MLQENKRLVDIIDPHICKSCIFGKEVRVIQENGNKVRMILCKRRDCDNFITKTIKQVKVSVI